MVNLKKKGTQTYLQRLLHVNWCQYVALCNVCIQWCSTGSQLIKWQNDFWLLYTRIAMQINLKKHFLWANKQIYLATIFWMTCIYSEALVQLPSWCFDRKGAWQLKNFQRNWTPLPPWSIIVFVVIFELAFKFLFNSTSFL